MSTCARCGREMKNQLGGNYYCPSCGYAENDLVYRPSNCDLPMPDGFGKQKGWICPVCGRGLSPWTSVCPCRSAGFKITYGSGVTCLNSDEGLQSTVTSINSAWNKYSTETEG